MKNLQKVSWIFSLGFGLVGLILINYFVMPVYSLHHPATLLVLFLLSLLAGGGLYASNIKVGVALPILVGLLIIFQLVNTTAIIKHEKYKEMIGEVNQKEFSTEISPIDLTKIPVVDDELAQNLGEKKLGEQIALGSQVTLDDFTLINIKDGLYWVAPLAHSGFFKWNDNKEGTPGYIKINATNPRDIELVQEANGEKIKIKYQPHGFFSDDLKRHVYKGGYKGVGLTDYSFELSDEGRAYWVITKYKKTIGFSGNKALGVIIVDAQNGEIKDYDMDHIPDWVDRVIPVNFAIDQLNDWGGYIHGWWNPSKKDVVKTTEGFNFIYNNGNCYVYTGLTSAGSDESTVGFVLINTKTKETTFYKVSGSHETASMASAEGKVQNLGYTATFPILINVENEPTYFMTLKDKKGLVKLYAMVNVKDYSVVGTGESIAKTKSNYMKYLRNRGDWQGVGTSEMEVQLEGTISRMGSSMIEDTTYYYFVINEKPDKIFIASLNMSNELPLTKVGDRVNIMYYENPNSSIDIMKFDNLVFNQTTAEDEEQIIKENSNQ